MAQSPASGSGRSPVVRQSARSRSIGATADGGIGSGAISHVSPSPPLSFGSPSSRRPSTPHAPHVHRFPLSHPGEPVRVSERRAEEGPRIAPRAWCPRCPGGHAAPVEAVLGDARAARSPGRVEHRTVQHRARSQRRPPGCATMPAWPSRTSSSSASGSRSGRCGATLPSTFARWAERPRRAARARLPRGSPPSRIRRSGWASGLERGRRTSPRGSSSRSTTAAIPPLWAPWGCSTSTTPTARASLGIALGERRGQGLGTEATRLVLDFAFNVMHLRNVMLETLAWNVGGQTAYERAGFRRIGVRRRSNMSRGQRTDMDPDGRGSRGLRGVGPGLTTPRATGAARRLAAPMRFCDRPGARQSSDLRIRFSR